MIWKTTVLTFMLVTFTSMVHADFTLSHGVGLRLEYDDNINLDPDGEEKDDFIASATPNVSITWETRHLTLSLNGGLTMEKYLDHTEEDNISPSLDQPTELDLLFNLYRDVFLLSITDTFSQEVIDEGDSRGEDNNTVNLTKTNRLRVNPYLQFQPTSSTRLQLGYTYENLWYSDEDGDDAVSHIYSTTLSQALSNRITMTLNGSSTLFRPKDVAKEINEGGEGEYEYDRQTASVGLTYQTTERLQLQGSYGRTWLDYDVREDTDSNIWSASFAYDITSTYSAGATFRKDYTVSVEDGPSDSDIFSAFLRYSDRYTLTFTLFSNSSSYVEIDRESDSYGGALSGELPFNEKTGLTGLISYANYDESGEERETYDRYSARLALYREILLGRLSAGYTYNREDSDIDTEGYTNNIFFMAASLSF